MAIFAETSFIVYARPRRQVLPIKLLADMARAGEKLPGFAYSLANAAPGSTSRVMASLPSAVTLRLLVPDIDLLPRDRQSTQPVYPWTNSVPSLAATGQQAAPWLRAVIESQVEGNATVLVTPSPLLDQSDGETELRRVLEWADTARSLKAAQGRPVLTGITLHRQWLLNDLKRELLMNVLTDSPDPAFYVLVRWPPARSGTTVGDLDVLAGYRELVEVLAADDREVVAARNGLAGWTLAALGASAWSAGISASHIDRDKVTFGRRPNTSPPAKIHYYLDPKLLSFVPEARIKAVSSVSGPPNCGCPDCRAMHDYDDHAASRHLLRMHTRLANVLAAANAPRRLALKRVNDAETILASHSLGLAAAQTGHLPSWARLLS